jgi:hypothetical protein
MARPPPIQRLPLSHLLIVPILLAIATIIALVFHSDVNVGLLYSQCHSRSRLPFLSRIPLLGSPACFLVSFFQESLASVRSSAALSAILSGVAGLLTVSTVESARLCNAPSALIAYPTGAWLVFNLIGGAVVWELVIIPAFLHRAKLMQKTGTTASADAEAQPDTTGRHLAATAEVVAIPVAVAVGFGAPSVAMLATRGHPVAIIVWLFFPVYVSLIRMMVRFGTVVFLAEHQHGPHHLESHRPSILAVYALPVLCSAAAHGFVLWSLFTRDDRKEMTRSVMAFIEVDFAFIALTVLYWLYVESGWRVALLTVGVSLIGGPGAGVCVGWLWREEQFGYVFEEPESETVDEEATVVGEESPLLG